MKYTKFQEGLNSHGYMSPMVWFTYLNTSTWVTICVCLPHKNCMCISLCSPWSRYKKYITWKLYLEAKYSWGHLFPLQTYIHQGRPNVCFTWTCSAIINSCVVNTLAIFYCPAIKIFLYDNMFISIDHKAMINGPQGIFLATTQIFCGQH